MFAMFSSLQGESKAALVDLPVVCELREVFLDDIIDIPLEREVKFTKDLVPDTRLMSMTHYRMSSI